MEKLGWLDVFKGQRCTNLAGHHLLLRLKTFAFGQSSTAVDHRLGWTSFWRIYIYIYIHARIRIRSIQTDAIAGAAVGTLFSGTCWSSERGCPFLTLIKPQLLRVPTDLFA